MKKLLHQERKIIKQIIIFIVLLLVFKVNIIFADTWNMNAIEPLTYVVYEAKTHPKANNRRMLDVRIVLAQKDAHGNIVEPNRDMVPTKEQLAATVIAAAKYAIKASGAQVAAVTLDSQYSTDDYGKIMLGFCMYAPDGGGISGTQGWTYADTTRVQPRGTTKQELQIQRLWGEMDEHHQGFTGTNDTTLSKAIAEKLGIKKEDVNPWKLLDVKIPVEFAEKVKPQKGLGDKRF